MQTKSGLVFHLPELLAAIVFVLGVVGTVVAKYKGLISFGKPIERRDCAKVSQMVCEEHTNMIMDVTRISEDVSETKSEMMGIRTEMKSMNEKLDNLIMHHAIKNGKDLR
jgi:hypothetical protein